MERQNCPERESYFNGTLASIVAAIIIAWLLYQAYEYGYQVLFQGVRLAGMIALLAIGVAAGYSYKKVGGELGERVSRYAPIVLGLAGIGVMVGVLGYPLIGGGLIVVSYFLEASIGLPLYKYSTRYSQLGAKLFIAGVLFYSVTLPLIVVDSRAALLPLIGDIVKTVGLVILASKAAGGC